MLVTGGLWEQRSRAPTAAPIPVHDGGGVSIVECWEAICCLLSTSPPSLCSFTPLVADWGCRTAAQTSAGLSHNGVLVLKADTKGEMVMKTTKVMH